MNAMHLLGLCLLLAAPVAKSAGFCVDTPDEMQAALDEAAATPELDVITVRATGLAAPPEGFTYLTNVDEPRDLTIRGGYGPFCLAAGRGVKSTIDLSAVQANDGLALRASSSVIRLSNLVFVHMPDNGDVEQNSAVSINAIAGEVDMEGNAFVLNDGVGGSALSIYAPAGMVRLVDNIISDNHTRHRALVVAGHGSPEGSVECELTNNTISRNLALGDAGVALLDCGPGIVRNNVLWGNTGIDLSLFGAASNSVYTVAFNDIQDIELEAMLEVSQSANFDADPGFVPGTYAYDPQPGSPLIDAGDPTTQVLLNPLDYYENPRVSDGRVDIGAIERRIVVFRNGFE